MSANILAVATRHVDGGFFDCELARIDMVGILPRQ